LSVTQGVGSQVCLPKTAWPPTYDYVLPNEALSKGDIDANAFQHKPYLDQQLKDRGYKLVAVGNTFVYPIAGYSKKIKSLDELQ
ncbi:MetQ/NlpA family ABC transporter substrate-binding protein, partial [Pseudomonas aeruginosa]|uniref:MetQ/NlpA family ABC transporter substrate-binding protein n=1 Tax=Pseudomonas aeruginosa TaxID=287 RepID=UPI00301BF6AE